MPLGNTCSPTPFTSMSHTKTRLSAGFVASTVRLMIFVAIVVFGVYPQALFDIFDPAVTALVATLGETLG